MNKFKQFLEDLKYSIILWFRDHNPRIIIGRMMQHGILLKNYRVNIKTLPASWVDSDHQMLHVNFQILSNFVEEECANMAIYCSILDDYQKTLSKSEKGIIYLDAYINDPEIDENKHHNACADACKIIKELYVWWTVTRPNRVEPYTIVTEDIGDNFLFLNNETKEKLLSDPELKKRYDIYYKQIKDSVKLEEQYYKEDTNQLVKLMKIRAYLWS